MNSAPALKDCPCCALSKSHEGFSPDRRNKDGLNYKCKDCAAAHFRVKYNLNPEHFRFAVKKYRESLHDHSA
jgi:hypothetical protein